MADFDAQLPVRTIATEFTTEVANAAGTTINPAEDYAQGSTTSGQNGILAQGAVTTAAPTYTTGQTSPLSLDTSGNLRVAATFTPSGLQNVNVTQWDTTALGAPSAYGTSPGAVNVIGVNSFVTNTVATTLASTTITGTVTVVQPTGANLNVDVANFPATQPVSGTVTANQGTANATPWNENIAQYGGVVTSLGQKVSASSIPVVIASDQSAIPVTMSSTTGVLTFFTDTAVASGATVTHSVAGPITLDKVAAAGSGELKMTVAIGTTGSEVTLWNSYTSASNQNTTMSMDSHSYIIPTGQSVKVTLKNRDTAAQDLSLTIFTH
jgi:hypothetical protein